MKTTYIADLRVGEELENEPFLIRDVVRRTTKNGRPYLLFTLADKTGSASGVFWDVPDYIEQLVRNGVPVLVTGRVVSYKDALQISSTDLNRDPDPDMSEFLPSSWRSRAEMIAELREHIGRLSPPWQRLTSHLLLDESFLSRFIQAPAARGMHHAFIGGLVEHTLSMAAIARHLAQHYPYVNEDLLLTGVLLHDMGKVHEYTTEGTFEFSDDGRLVGHIVRAITMIEAAAAELGDIPEDDLRHLIHLVASHHGKLEWGSPVIPKTLEALLLHQIDLLDSRIQGFLDYLKSGATDEAWTSKPSPMFGTRLRRPSGYDE